MDVSFRHLEPFNRLKEFVADAAKVSASHFQEERSMPNIASVLNANRGAGG